MAIFSLKDDETKGNEADEHNVANDSYNEKFNQIKQAEENADFNDIINREYGEGATKGKRVDSHGDIVDKNWNSSGEEIDDVKDREESAKAAQKINDDEEDQKNKEREKKKGKKKTGRFKGSGSTIAAGGIVVFIGGILVSMASGTSFWMALEKQLTNDGTDDSRLNIVMHRAFNSQFKTCKPGTLSCKFKTMPKNSVAKLKNGLMKVKGKITDSTGKVIREAPEGSGGYIDATDLGEGERVKPDSLEFDTGRSVSSVGELNGYVDTDIHARSMQLRVTDPAKTDFVDGSFSAEIDARYKINKSKPTAEEGEVDNAAKGIDGAVGDSLEKQKTFSMSDPAGSVKSLAKVMFGSSAQAVVSGFDYLCQAYNMTRIAVGVVKAKWALDLIRYAWPYLRLISKIADNSATDEDFAEIQAKFAELTDYLSITKAEGLKKRVANDQLTDDDKALLEQYGIKPPSEKGLTLDKLASFGKIRTKEDVIRDIDENKNKNAFDSQGLRTVMYGDGHAVSEFSKQFGIGAIGALALSADTLIKWTQSVAAGFGSSSVGKQNIKSFCKVIKSADTYQSVAGLAETGADIASCVSAAAPTGITQFTGGYSCLKIVGKALLKAGSMYLVQNALITLASAGLVAALAYFLPKLPSGEGTALKGPAIGNVLASGVALMLAHKSQGSGLKPALSKLAVGAFIAKTQKTHDMYTTEIARYNARSEPFNINNPNSFLGMIMAKINPTPVVPGTMPNAFNILSSIFNISASLPSNTALALHSSPSLITANEAMMNKRLNDGKCEADLEKGDEGMMCDRTSGRAINIASPRVLQWAEEDASGKTDHLSEIIEWMQASHGKNNNEGYGPESGTGDETCSDFTAFLSLDLDKFINCDNAAEFISIDDKGAVKEGSQFDMFIKYCTDQRELEIGSTDLDNTEGSDKMQDWHSGKQCGKTYDSAGNPSSSSKFNPDKDTGNGSYMMDAFTYYYNMCYVQYAMANNATDCTNDNPPSGGAQAVSSGNGSIVDSANMMGKWGAEYNACYDQKRGHDTAWMDRAMENHFTGEYATDCSEFVRIVIYHATGNDVGEINTMTMCNGNPNFERIPRSEAKPGDFTMDDSCTHHTEVIVAINPDGTFQTVGSHTYGCGPGFGPSPSNHQGGAYVIRYKGASK